MYGAKINSIRLARGLKQEYVAEKLGINQKAYSRIETDEKVKIDDPLLQKIAEVLGVSVDDIKSPTPIVMNFHNSSYSGQINGQYNANEKLIEQLSNQLKVKDKQIEELTSLVCSLAKK